MITAVKNILRKIRNKVLGRQAPVQSPSLIGSYSYLELQQILNGQKLVMVDVGGAVNLQPHHHKLIGNTLFYIFEPDERSYNDLVNTVNRYSHPGDFQYINTALSGTDGKRTLYLSNVPTGSSILKLNPDQPLISKNSPYFFPMREIEIETFKLETVLNKHNIKYFDAIKLDVQGAEFEIIKGIDDKRLDEVNVIELEIGLHEIYLNQAQFCEVLSFMTDKGFSLFDLRTNRNHIPSSMDNFSYQEKYFGTHDQSPSVSARLSEFDAIFFRDPLWVKNKNISKERLLRIVGLYCVYNFFGEAMQVVNSAFENGKLSASELESVKTSIINWNKKEQNNTMSYDTALKSNNYYVWAQYMWVPYPSN
jgi:FkbM family methyltransferase